MIYCDRFLLFSMDSNNINIATGATPEHGTCIETFFHLYSSKCNIIPVLESQGGFIEFFHLEWGYICNISCFIRINNKHNSHLSKMRVGLVMFPCGANFSPTQKLHLPLALQPPLIHTSHLLMGKSI